MLAIQKRGAVTFDYGNNVRTVAFDAGVTHAFDIPGFIPEYIRPLFCEGKGPFRWVALSGDPRDIARTDELVFELFRMTSTCGAGSRFRGRSASSSRDFPGAHLLAGAGRLRTVRRGLERPRGAR